MTAAAFESFVPSEPSWTMGRSRQIADDASSCGSIESNCSLDMSFPDPECSLSKTQDSLSTQPEWKSEGFTKFRSALESSVTSIATENRNPTRPSPTAAVNETNEDAAAATVCACLSHFQVTVVYRIREAFTKAQLFIRRYCHLDIKTLFLVLSFLIPLLAYIGLLYAGNGSPAHDITCKFTGRPSFIGCAFEPLSTQRNAEPDPPVNNAILVQFQIQTFNNVVENSRGIGKTSVEIRRTGIVMSELQALLEASDISGKYKLSEAIADYRTHSFHVGRGLEQFRSNLLATLGSLSILSDNLVYEVEAGERASSNIPKWLTKITHRSLKPVALANRLYYELAEYNRGELNDLHSQAIGQLHALDGVSRDLHSIYSLATHGKRRKDGELESVLGDLFTKLGGNKGKVSKHREDIALLGVVERGYREARAQVEMIIHQLEMMTLDLQSAGGKASAASKLALLGYSSPMDSVRTFKRMTDNLLESAKERLEFGTPSQVAQRFVERE